MVLQSSGQIAISNINTELGLGSTSTLGLDDGRARALAARLGGQVAMSDFWGKIAPEYWWSANYGLSTSGWTAIRGGLNFTFFNVSSANSSTGVFFNGSNSFGITQGLPSNVDARAVIMRFDSFSKPGGTVRAPIGGTQNNIHQAHMYFNSGGFFWYYVEHLGGGTFTYAARTNNDGATSAIHADFWNAGAPQVYYNLNSGASTASIYAGAFTNRFRWNAGSQIYIGRRQEGNYAQLYIKELAIFTSGQSAAFWQNFRNQMYQRWP